MAIYLWRLLEASGRRVLSFCGEAKGGDLPDSTPIWHHASCPPTRKALVGARSPASSTRKASRRPAAGRSGTRRRFGPSCSHTQPDLTAALQRSLVAATKAILRRPRRGTGRNGKDIVRTMLRVVEDAGRDPWCRWIVQHRHGGDDEFRRELFTAFLTPLRDRLLAAAHIQEGEVVLDLGTGDGLIGFGALERVGPSGRVIFNDLSADLLGLCRDYAAETGVLGPMPVCPRRC